jgi:hypothetical protein
VTRLSILLLLFYAVLRIGPLSSFALIAVGLACVVACVVACGVVVIPGKGARA